ncbi:MAG: efflux RND transporter periplasmic adaptor subunit, partial [Anaerolineae bacterium]
DNVLLLASKAIKRDAQGTYVLVQTPAGSRRVNVTIGITNGTQTEITSGLKEGDVVLLSSSTTTTSTTTTNRGGFGLPGIGVGR